MKTENDELKFMYAIIQVFSNDGMDNLKAVVQVIFMLLSFLNLYLYLFLCIFFENLLLVFSLLTISRWVDKMICNLHTTLLQELVDVILQMWQNHPMGKYEKCCLYIYFYGDFKFNWKSKPYC